MVRSMNANAFKIPEFHFLKKKMYGKPSSLTGRLTGCYQTCALAVALTAIYTNLAIYWYVLNPGMLPKFVFFGILFSFLPVLVAKYRELGAYFSSAFMLWATLLLILNVIHFLGFNTSGNSGGIVLIDHDSEARRSLVETRAQYILLAMMFGFVAYINHGRKYLYAVVLLMVVVPCAVITDFIRPGLLYPLETEGAVLGRAAAMFINPTMAGEAILHIFLLGCALTKMQYRGPLFLLAGVAILSTFSRSSIIAWVLVMVILVSKKTLPRWAPFATAVAVGATLLCLGSFENYLQSRHEFEAASSNILSRLDFFSSLKFDDDSSEERAYVIKAAWDLFLQNPVFGAGAGATQFWSYRASTHNQLLLLAAEYGIFGVSLWAWMIAILWRGNFFRDRGLQIAMVFLFAFMSLFTHQMFDSATYWLVTYALVSVKRNDAVRA